MGNKPTPQSFAVTQLHKSIGITILLLSLIRLGWRLTNPPPPEPPTLAPWERMLSQVVHWGFYFVMIAMPLTGWLMVSASKTAIPTVLFWTVLLAEHPGRSRWPGAGRQGRWRTPSARPPTGAGLGGLSASSSCTSAAR